MAARDRTSRTGTFRTGTSRTGTFRTGTSRTGTFRTGTGRTETIFRARGGQPSKRVRRQEWLFRVEEQATRAAKWAGETITPGGWFLLATVAAALIVGLPLAWMPLVAAGVAGLVLVLVALLFLLGGRSFQVQVSVAKDRVEVGEPLGGELSVQNAGRGVSLPTILTLPVGAGLVEVGIPFLRAGAAFNEDLNIPTQKRAVVQVGPPATTQSSPLGIFVRETVWPGSHTVYVYPKTTALPATTSGLIRDLEGEPHARIVPDDLSFHAIREYQPGDQRRHIHWKSTAKTGRLMVRQYEETVRSEMLIVLSTRAGEYQDEDEFELAVSVAGSFGLRALQDGRSVRFAAGAPLPQLAASGLSAVTTIATTGAGPLLDDLAGVEASGNANRLPHLVEVAADSAEEASIAVVVTGSQVSLTDLRSTTLSFGPDVALLAVQCDRYAKPALRQVGGITIATVALLEDLRQLMLRRSQQ